MKSLKYIGILIFITLMISFSGNISENLGSNYWFFPGDRIEDNIIVNCNSKSFFKCRGGSYAIPNYEAHYHNGEYDHYISDYTYNDKWIIARTISKRESKEFYWALNKHNDVVSGPIPESDFETFKMKQNILRLKL